MKPKYLAFDGIELISYCRNLSHISFVVIHDSPNFRFETALEQSSSVRLWNFISLECVKKWLSIRKEEEEERQSAAFAIRPYLMHGVQMFFLLIYL